MITCDNLSSFNPLGSKISTLSAPPVRRSLIIRREAYWPNAHGRSPHGVPSLDDGASAAPKGLINEPPFRDISSSKYRFWDQNILFEKSRSDFILDQETQRLSRSEISRRGIHRSRAFTQRYTVVVVSPSSVFSFSFLSVDGTTPPSPANQTRKHNPHNQSINQSNTYKSLHLCRMNAKRNVNEFRQRLLSVVVKWYQTVFLFSLRVCTGIVIYGISVRATIGRGEHRNEVTKLSRPRDREHYIIYMYVYTHAHTHIYMCILYIRYRLRSFDRWRSHRRSPKRSLPVRDRPLHKSKIALLRTKRHTKLVVL